MGKKPTDEQFDEELKQMVFGLHLAGFAVAKRIAEYRGLTSGTIVCPLCRAHLRFSIAASNGHMRAKCESTKCINMME